MLYSIENEKLKITVHTDGAQLYSLYSKVTNTEYLWQGDPVFWTGRAYNLFPFIGRMVEGRFTYQGQSYPSRSHGLARYYPFTMERQSEDTLVFVFADNEDTRKEYPFSFTFRVFFILQGSTLITRYEVENTDTRTLICAFGGHPGINVPFGNGAFEDYYLEFSQVTPVRQQLYADGTTFMGDATKPYPLVDGTKLPLRHGLFVNDAVILENTSGRVSLKTDKDNRYVTMDFADYPFIGFWHTDKEGAPYVCLEPWSALPATNGKVVDLESKPNMTHVPAGETASKTFTLEIHENENL